MRSRCDDLRERAVVHRHLVVRIGANVAVPGEMLADARHARRGEARLQRFGQHGDRVGILVQRAIADHARLAVVHVEHRREAEVHAVRLQLAADHEAATARGGERLRRIAVPELAEFPHRRDRREAVLEALHAPALVIDRDQQVRRANLADRVGELDQLQRRREVAREEDHATHLRMLQALDVVRRELEAADVHHHGAEFHFPSRTTKAIATSPSSVRDMWVSVTPIFFRWEAMAWLGSIPGLPFAFRVTVMLCHVKGAWIPVPIAFENASFAAKRFARCAPLSLIRASGAVRPA